MKLWVSDVNTMKQVWGNATEAAMEVSFIYSLNKDSSPMNTVPGVNTRFYVLQ